MGGTTITIQEDGLLKAIEELNKQREEIEENYHLFLDSITILGKEGEIEPPIYRAIGDKGIETAVGLNANTKLEKNIIIFAHFGK